MVLPDMSSRFVESALQSKSCNILTSNAGMEQPDYFKFHCQLTKVLLTRHIYMCFRCHDTIFRRMNRAHVTLLYSLFALSTFFLTIWAIEDRRLNHIVETTTYSQPEASCCFCQADDLPVRGAELCTKQLLVFSFPWKHFNISTTII